MSRAEPPAPTGPGPVESGVTAEIQGPGAEARPGLAAAALAMGRVIDNPKVVNQHASAARELAMLVDRLHAASTRSRRGSLAAVKSMTSGDDTAGA